MNPFDLKAALLAPHAQHPVFIHFPIALLLTSVAFEWLALWRGSVALAVLAKGNLAAASWTVPLALVTGFAAWQWRFEGAPIKGNLRLHVIGALTSATMIWLLYWLRSRRPGGNTALTLPDDRVYLGLTLCAAAVLGMTAHLGGFLSGVNGITRP